MVTYQILQEDPLQVQLILTILTKKLRVIFSQRFIINI